MSDLFEKRENNHGFRSYSCWPGARIEWPGITVQDTALCKYVFVSTPPEFQQHVYFLFTEVPHDRGLISPVATLVGDEREAWVLRKTESFPQLEYNKVEGSHPENSGLGSSQRQRWLNFVAICDFSSTSTNWPPVGRAAYSLENLIAKLTIFSSHNNRSTVPSRVPRFLSCVQ